jgi:energy-coupling factor transporter ATP-binding protein EcfA2
LNRITVITGHFGSGKSELALNLAKKLNDEGEKVSLVDIDIVNPFFCIRDFKEKLAEVDIEVISAKPEWSNAELMVVPGEVSGIFVRNDRHFIIDIGGDDRGAMVLGQYNRNFKETPYDMYFVVNTRRPMTPNEKGVKEYLKDIERASRLKVTHLISNTNLSYETDVEDIVKGDEIVSKLSKELGIPHLYTVVRRDLVEEVTGRLKGEILPIDIHMKTPWSE